MKRAPVPTLVIGVVLAVSLSCARHGDYPAPALGVLVDASLRVVDVAPGGAAELAGLQVGDVLHALNGAAYTSVDDWRTEVSRIEVGQTYQLEIRRGGQVMTLTVTSASWPLAQPTPGVTPTPVPTGIYSV